MTSTTNKSLTLPGHGTDVNSWDTPVNGNFTAIDSALGGVTTLSVTSQSGTISLSATQYTPQNIEISGTLTANVNYQIPSGVGGRWSIQNTATGSFSVFFSTAAGGASITLPQGRVCLVADGTSTGIQFETTGLGINTYPTFIAPQQVYDGGFTGGFSTYNLSSSPFSLPKTAHVGIFSVIALVTGSVNIQAQLYARDSSTGVWANSGSGVSVFAFEAGPSSLGATFGGGMIMVPLTLSQTCDFYFAGATSTGSATAIINLVGYF